jgi:hypothetical protein
MHDPGVRAFEPCQYDLDRLARLQRTVNTLGSVPIRMNATSVISGKPISSRPESASSSHARAASWRGLDESDA